MNADEAVANAVRILGFAEDESDLVKMAALTAFGDCWTRIAELLSEREAAV